MSKTTLAYLASPYSNLDLVNAWIDASVIAGRLLRSGVRVFSPIAHAHAIALHCQDIDPLDHAFWLPICEAFMERCDVLIVAHMEGWQESKGIAHEVAFFERARKPIFDLPDITTINMVRRHPSDFDVTVARSRLKELREALAGAKTWGAAVAARNEEYKSIRQTLAAYGFSEQE